MSLCAINLTQTFDVDSLHVSHKNVQPMVDGLVTLIHVLFQLGLSPNISVSCILLSCHARLIVLSLSLSAIIILCFLGNKIDIFQGPSLFVIFQAKIDMCGLKWYAVFSGCTLLFHKWYICYISYFFICWWMLVENYCSSMKVL